MKLTTPLVTVAASLLFVASHPAQAEPLAAAQNADSVAVASNAVMVAQADITSPREYRANEPSYASPGKRGARAAAQTGPDALRRYVDRTRMIYALDYQEFAQFSN